MVSISNFKLGKSNVDLSLMVNLNLLLRNCKCKTLLHWSGDTGLELYQSWGIADKDLTLQNIWDKFEEHCKPQANELRTCYDLLKKLKQPSLSWWPVLCCYTKPVFILSVPYRNSITYLKEVFFCLDSVTKCLMSKIITEDENLTTAETWQRLKKLEWSGHCQTHHQ